MDQDRAAIAADVAAFQQRTLEPSATNEEVVVGKDVRVVKEIGGGTQAVDQVASRSAGDQPACLPRVIDSRPSGWSILVRYLTAALALLAAGCALATATPPKVEVAAVELRSLGLLDHTLRVTLCVSNPNSTEFSFRKVTVALEVANAPLAESTSEAQVRLPPLSSVLVPFTVDTTVRNLGPQLWDVVRSGGVEYRVHGSVQLDGVLAISLPFSRVGRLDLLAAGARLLSLHGQLDLLAKGTRLLADTTATASDTRCNSVVAS